MAKASNSQLQLHFPLAFMLKHMIFYFMYMQILLAVELFLFHSEEAII